MSYSLSCCLRYFKFFVCLLPQAFLSPQIPPVQAEKKTSKTYLVIQSVKTQQVKDCEGNFCSNVCLCVYILYNVCFIGGAYSIKKER